MMKKLLTILLTFVMMFSFVGMTASAEEKTGKITISPAAQGATYKVYKLFELDTFDAQANAYTYLIEENSPWRTFFTTEVEEYFTIESAVYQRDGKNYHIIKSTTLYTTETAVDVAKAALEYAKEKEEEHIDLGGQTITEDNNDGKVEFTNMPWGYYLVDTSVGALCGLTSTTPNADVAVKNYAPSLDKNVAEDDIKVGNNWGISNDAAINEIVEFDVTIHARIGADNYIYHDTMENGLELIEDSIDIKYVGFGLDESQAVTLEEGESKDYTVKTGTQCADGCDFEIIFSKAVCDGLKDNDTIVMTYKAKVTALNAIDEDGIKNEAWVSYGDIGSQLTTASAITHTTFYGFDIIKTDASKNMLDGAEFKLFTSENDAKVKDDSKAIHLIKIAENSYRLATEEEIAAQVNDLTKVIDVNMNDNKTIAKVIGLDNGTYYLAETKWPEGYNELAAPRMFTISDASVFAKYKDDGSYDTAGVHIENRAGAAMPETGGMGTTLFVSLGAIVVLGTGVLLVTKKRMSMIDD